MGELLSAFPFASKRDIIRKIIFTSTSRPETSLDKLTRALEAIDIPKSRIRLGGNTSIFNNSPYLDESETRDIWEMVQQWCNAVIKESMTKHTIVRVHIYQMVVHAWISRFSAIKDSYGIIFDIHCTRDLVLDHFFSALFDMFASTFIKKKSGSTYSMDDTDELEPYKTALMALLVVDREYKILKHIQIIISMATKWPKAEKDVYTEYIEDRKNVMKGFLYENDEKLYLQLGQQVDLIDTISPTDAISDTSAWKVKNPDHEKRFEQEINRIVFTLTQNPTEERSTWSTIITSILGITRKCC